MAENKKQKETNLENKNEEKKELEECRKKMDEYLAGWQRARADFLNYKKEEIERIGEILKYANIGLILKILPILDNFDKAEKEIPKEKKNDKFLQGILQIKTQILDFLKQQEIKEIKCVGEKFDPNFMEAIETADSVSAEDLANKSGIVLEEIQKGYTIHDRVLRPAKVKVTK